jgi:hypothetical protein
MEGFQVVAKQFINTTRSHLFLTGKAGTGKTTFLKNLSAITHKTFLVVAPTGIAALNAGGVTIHSQFLFPFGTFIPDKYLGDNFEGKPFYTQNTLAHKHPLNSARKQVLRSIDLLVIDEVSMLRADLLDAIDYRMKAARGNFNESFGGVQVLFIGDLYQLPPVVKRDEETLLGKYYNTPWFYEAKALVNDPLIFIELDKIYRQHDDVFISLLNNLRNNIVTQNDIDELNKHHRTPAEIESMTEVITLTTHNYKADELNSKALANLPGRSHFCDASVADEFPDSMFPVLNRLELKVGAQVMFVRNDIDGEYFNGKLATVADISGSDVWVEVAGSRARQKLKRETWQNKKYTLIEASKELNEEVIGSFEQYPVKLAWAITVHKSQGLTFDKAIIDVAEAFADGQVYVALSRLRSLDGLILRTKIKAQSISTDKNVASFVKANHKPDGLDNLMKSRQREFLAHYIQKTFDFGNVIKECRYVIKDNAEGAHKDLLKGTLIPIAEALESERTNTEKFRAQLANLLINDQNLFVERIQKGSTYYHQVLSDKLKSLLNHQEQVRQHKRVKTYLTQLTELDSLLTQKIKAVDKAYGLTQSILYGNENFTDEKLNEQRLAERAAMLEEIRRDLPEIAIIKPKKGKKKKQKDEPSTHDISIQLLKDGMSIKEIAEHRSLVPSTIEGHLAKGVEMKVIGISDFVHEEALTAITTIMDESAEEKTLTQLYQHFKAKYSYGLLRAVVAHRALANTSEANS